MENGRIAQLKRVAKATLPLLLPALCLAQGGPLSGAVGGVSTEVVSAIRIGAYAIVAVLALWTAFGEHGAGKKVIGALLCLFVALNPQLIATWIQGL